MEKEVMLVEGYIALVEDATRELNRLIEVVSKSITVEITEDGVSTHCKLTKDDLCALSMRIPAECAYVQSVLNSVAMEQVVEVMELKHDSNQQMLMEREGKSTIKDRQAAADIVTYDKGLVNAAKQQAVRNIQACIDRADKTYEGIKKVMDLYNRDAWVNKKG